LSGHLGHDAGLPVNRLHHVARVGYVRVDAPSSCFYLKRFLVSFCLVRSAYACIRFWIDHRDTTILLAESHKDRLRAFVVPQIVGIFAKINRLAKDVRRAVVHSHVAVFCVCHIKLVNAGNIQRALRLREPLDAVNHPSGENVNHFHSIVAECGDEQPPPVFFGVFEVDLKACELRKHGLRIKLPEQPFQVLVVLLEKPGEIVTREELRNRLWPGDTFVDFDHGLNNAVMRLREVLGDASENPRFVETIPRRGYRFIAPVIGSAVPGPTTTDSEVESGLVPIKAASPTVERAALEATSQPASIRRQPATTRLAILITAILALAGIGAGLFHYARVGTTKSNRVQNKSLIVLPIENLSGDKDQEYFADGMTDDLIANLAKIRSPRVISRSTAMAYKGTRRPMSQIASELNVDAVFEGTVLRVGNRVRITAELVQVSTDRHLWAETYESQMGDILALQNRVSSAIVNEIRINLMPEDQERLAKKPAVAPEGYENYLKGRYYWNKRSDENLTRAIGYFEQATHQDPQYALAYAGLSDCYAIISAEIFGTMPAAEAAPNASGFVLTGKPAVIRRERRDEDWPPENLLIKW
jgi:TolB-like protein/DNA-binding winged helix-turn-helix (wHTH) protein